MKSIQTKPLQLSSLDGLVRSFSSMIKSGDVVTFSGELGAGKTTFVKLLASKLGLQDGEVSSPTYVIHHIYPARIPIHHIDLYRLESLTQVESLGFEEFMGVDGVTFIEWFEKFPSIWSDSRMHIEIAISNEEYRSYKFTYFGDDNRWDSFFQDQSA